MLGAILSKLLVGNNEKVKLENVPLYEQIERQVEKMDAETDFSEEEIALRKRFHQLTRNEMDGIFGKDITILLGKGKLDGKLLNNQFFENSGYSFITRSNDGTISELLPIFPSDVRRKGFLSSYRINMYHLDGNRYLLHGPKGIGTHNHFRNANFFSNYEKLDAFLRQSVLNLEAV